MPLYDYRDKTTGEVKEYRLGNDERSQFETDNPNLELVWLKAPSCTNRFVALSTPGSKPPEDYTSLLKRIKKNNPGSVINVR